MRRVKIRMVLFVVVLGLRTLCSAGLAVELHVPNPYGTIQAAIDAASEGDEIIVSIGTYYENINFGGKDIILCSTDPTNPIVVASTIIDGRLGGSVVTFSGTESPACMLCGFTIINGRGTGVGDTRGGGMYGNGTLATIQHNIISGNRTVSPLWPCSGYGGESTIVMAPSNVISFQETGSLVMKEVLLEVVCTIVMASSRTTSSQTIWHLDLGLPPVAVSATAMPPFRTIPSLATQRATMEVGLVIATVPLETALSGKIPLIREHNSTYPPHLLTLAFRIG